MGVVKATAAIAHGVGIEVMRNGTQLFASDGRYQYDVVAACSGVRSLVALTALSVLAGYLSFKGRTRRALVLLLCFPLVYLGNVARLTTIVVAAQIGGQKWGDLAHQVMGVGVFVIVLGGVLGAVLALEKWWPEGEARKTEDGERRTEGRDARPARPIESVQASRTTDGRAARPYLVVSAIVALAIGEMIFLHQLANSPARGSAGVALAADGVNPVELPAFIGTEWIGRRTEITAIEREILPEDTGFSRKLYVPVADPAKHVLFSLVLSGRDRTSIHRPELCLVGQGWTIEGTMTARFRGDAAREFPATVLRVRREVMTPRGKTVVPQLVAYWFVSADRVLATHWERVALDAWNRVAHARADRWAYALMQTDASDGEAAALARMQTVLDGTLPSFQRVTD
jgi:exosortase/archaeosortase family protein